MCVDNILIFSKDKMLIDIFIKLLLEGNDKFKLTDEGNIRKYLGVSIKKDKDSSYDIRQLYLIQCIISELNLDNTLVQKCSTPVVKPLLYKDLEGKECIKP